MRISACLDALFPGVPSVDALRRAAYAGAKAVEIWGWWDKDMEGLAAASRAAGLEVAAICTKFESLVDGVSRKAYLDGLRETVAVAKKLHCPIIISQVGQHVPDLSFQEQRENLVEGLRQAALLLEGTEQTLAVEPLNTRVDHPGYFLSSSDVAAEILREVGSPRVKMLFDIYHQQIMEGDVLTRIQACLPWICHIHAAGVPGRHELASGELDYGNIFKAIEKMGYEGFAALELWTSQPEEEISRWCGK